MSDSMETHILAGKPHENTMGTGLRLSRNAHHPNQVSIYFKKSNSTPDHLWFDINELRDKLIPFLQSQLIGDDHAGGTVVDLDNEGNPLVEFTNKERAWVRDTSPSQMHDDLQPGNWVRQTSGMWFSNGKMVVTVNRIERSSTRSDLDKIWFRETDSYLPRHKVERATPEGAALDARDAEIARLQRERDEQKHRADALERALRQIKWNAKTPREMYERHGPTWTSRETGHEYEDTSAHLEFAEEIEHLASSALTDQSSRATGTWASAEDFDHVAAEQADDAGEQDCCAKARADQRERCARIAERKREFGVSRAIRQGGNDE